MEFKYARKISKFFGARVVFLGIQHMYGVHRSQNIRVHLLGDCGALRFTFSWKIGIAKSLLCVLTLYADICCTIIDTRRWDGMFQGWKAAVLIRIPVISVILTGEDDWLLKISISLSACD